jgi:hypothetical protein
MNNTIKKNNSDFEVKPLYFETKKEALSYLDQHKKIREKQRSMFFEPNFKVISFIEKFNKTFDTTVRIIAASKDFLILQPFLRDPLIISLANVSGIQIIFDLETQKFSILTDSGHACR